MTGKNLKKSRGKSGTRVTPAAASSASQKPATAVLRLSKLSFLALNDFYVIEEDPIDFLDSGMSADVEKALKESKLYLPDAFSSFAEKYPCTGIVVSRGNKTKYSEIELGTRVMFARLGVQRYLVNGKSYVNVLESDLHAILD